MKKSAVLVALALGWTTLRWASADEPKPTPPATPPVFKYIDWSPDLSTAFADAKKADKMVFIAINADLINGKPERANTELRENTYRAEEVVAKSRSFVCALVKYDAASADFNELRSHFGIEGRGIVAPQHIFAFPDGTLALRREYWSPAPGKVSVDALVELMDEALAKDKSRRGTPALPPAPPNPTSPDPTMPGETPKTPDRSTPPATGGQATDSQRTEWIRALLERVRTGDKDAKDGAIKELVKGDQKGDCVEPLCTILVEVKKDPDLQIAILKGLGKPGLEIALPTVEGLLDDKFEELRQNAAITLEYIGSPKSVPALTKRIAKEHELEVHGDLCRALGRCGAKQEEVRKTLLHEAGAAKKPEGVLGPVIGLAYFEKDADVARALEKMAKKDNGDYLKRTVELWAIAEVMDPKSATWMKKDYLADEKDPKGWIEELVHSYNHAILAKLEGSADQQGAIDGGVEGTYGYRGLHISSARRNRDQTEFKPKGEFDGKTFGGGRGGPGGPPPVPPGMGG